MMLELLLPPQDLTLAQFILAAAPSPSKRCWVVRPKRTRWSQPFPLSYLATPIPFSQRNDPRTNAPSGCGEGVTAHVRTFLHGTGRITLSIATLPHGEALPGEEKQQVWE